MILLVIEQGEPEQKEAKSGEFRNER